VKDATVLYLYHVSERIGSGTAGRTITVTRLATDSPYTFHVVACNQAGCTAGPSITVTTPERPATIISKFASSPFRTLVPGGQAAALRQQQETLAQKAASGQPTSLGSLGRSQAISQMRQVPATHPITRPTTRRETTTARKRERTVVPPQLRAAEFRFRLF